MLHKRLVSPPPSVKWPHIPRLAAIHKSSAFSTPHPSLTHRCWNQMLRVSPTRNLANLEFIPHLQVLCCYLCSDTHPSVHAVPLCARGPRTRHIYHISYCHSDRQQARFLQRPITQGSWGKRKALVGSLTAGLGSVID